MFLFDLSNPRKIHVLKDIFLLLMEQKWASVTFVIKTCKSKPLTFCVPDNCIKIHCFKIIFVIQPFSIKWCKRGILELRNEAYQAYSKWNMSNLFWDLLSQRLLEETWMAKHHCPSCMTVQRLFSFFFLKTPPPLPSSILYQITMNLKIWAVTIKAKPPSIN